MLVKCLSPLLEDRVVEQRKRASVKVNDRGCAKWGRSKFGRHSLKGLVRAGVCFVGTSKSYVWLAQSCLCLVGAYKSMPSCMNMSVFYW